jgi:DNA-binding HxlR family transcriptional regulator
MVRILVGCKWSLSIFRSILAGTVRPGALVRAHEGLSTKVLNQCLRRHLDYGILVKTSFAEVPPRVEYHLTPFGERFTLVLEAIDELGRERVEVG